MPLTMALIGERNTIQKIIGKDSVRQHLTELGFVVGSDVTIIAKLGCNLILSIKESRIALDKAMATRIMLK